MILKDCPQLEFCMQSRLEIQNVNDPFVYFCKDDCVCLQCYRLGYAKGVAEGKNEEGGEKK